MHASTPHISVINVIRGFAITGIIFANILWLSGYLLLPLEAQHQFSSTLLDKSLLFFNNVFIRFKFYSLFSFLFGVGFSILLARAQNSPDKSFYFSYTTRLFILFIIGWANAMLLIHGDILRLYAIIGLVMLLFKNMSDRNLLKLSIIAFFMPVIIGLSASLNLYYFDPAHYFTFSPKATIYIFQHGSWHDYLFSNFERTQNYLANNLTSRRFFKILGLFLLGFYVGHKKIFHHLDTYIPAIKRLLPWAWGISLTNNIIYTLWDNQMSSVVKELVYIISVYPMVFTYIITLIYLCRKSEGGKIKDAFANVGRMSLSNYLMQSLLANIFMLWYGLGMAAQLHIYDYYLISVFILMIIFIFSHYWMKYFRYGPAEYLVRYMVR
jgi:uncharacterized protein